MALITSLYPLVRQRIAIAIPDKGIADALRWAAYEFMCETWWERETIPVTVVENTNAYQLASADPALDVIGIQAAQIGANEFLTPGTKESVEYGQRGWYFFEPPDYIQMSWAPTAADADDGLMVRCAMTIKDDATTIPDTVLRRWKTTIRNGALMHLLSMASAPWFNEERAARYEVMWNDGLDKAAAEAARQGKSYAYGSVQS